MRDSAVIFVPPTVSLDGLYTQDCISYALGRHYQLAAIERDWRKIERMLREGLASVVVVAREQHHTYTESTADQTQVIQGQSQFTEDRVRRILNAEEPVPAGVAPETVAALRLIWWRLQDRA
jgi:hypothetical protein